jgi:hypothetical protein
MIPIGEDAKETVGQEADRLVNGDRQSAYGHPLDDFSKTALIWQAILGVPVTAEQVALCMIGVKISRECNIHKRDNIVDGIGYWLTLDKVIKERARRQVQELISSPEYEAEMADLPY